jgi:hypothetical protein
MSPVIGVESKVEFGKRVLNYFFDLFALGKEAAGNAGHLAAVTVEERFERGFVAGASGRDQSVVCGFFRRMQ